LRLGHELLGGHAGLHLLLVVAVVMHPLEYLLNIKFTYCGVSVSGW
jgi:hypothetical protein